MSHSMPASSAVSSPAAAIPSSAAAVTSTSMAGRPDSSTISPPAPAAGDNDPRGNYDDEDDEDEDEETELVPSSSAADKGKKKAPATPSKKGKGIGIPLKLKLKDLVSASPVASPSRPAKSSPAKDFDEYRFEYHLERASDVSLSLQELEPSPENSLAEIMEEPSPVQPHSSSSPPLPWWRLFLLNVYWFAFSLLWFMLLVIVVPSQIKELRGDDNKGHGMFVLFTISGMVTFIGSLLMGYANDRMADTRLGRRRPLIFVGCLAMVPFLFGIALTSDFGLYVLLYICLTFASVVSTVPYNGLFADVVPMSQHGYASAIMGALSQTGNLVGASLGLFYVNMGIYTFVILSFIVTLSMLITVLSTPERPSNRSNSKTRAKPKKKLTLARIQKNCNPTRLYNAIIVPLIGSLLRSHDFRWVFYMRFVFQLGLYTVQEYLQFWLSNCVEIPEGIGSAETAVSICVLPMLVTAIISSLAGGIISDRLGGQRKILVYFSGGLMVGCSASFMFVSNFYLAAGLAGLVGLGFGCFLSVDFAIVMDVLPSKTDYARDMALWNCALIIPQVIATPFAGLMLDAFQRAGVAAGVDCLGYKVIFALAAFYFFLGTIFVEKIHGIR